MWVHQVICKYTFDLKMIFGNPYVMHASSSEGYMPQFSEFRTRNGSFGGLLAPSGEADPIRTPTVACHTVPPSDMLGKVTRS